MNIKPPRTGVNPGAPSSTPVSSGSAAGPARTPANGSTPGSGDTVTITSAAAEMLKLEESLARIPEVDNELVVAIRASIAEGAYQVDPEKIADRLMALDKKEAE